MLHPPGFRHRSRNVYNRWQRIDRRRGANLLHVVHAILHAEDQRAGSKQRSQLPRCRGVVRGFYAEENNFRTAHRAKFGGRFNSHTLLKLQRVEEKPVLLHSFNKRRTPDHHRRRPRARQQSAEVSAHGPRTNHRNLWPPSLFGHGVTTPMSRSMSRSVLYRWGETRMLPSRRLTTTFSLRRRL